MQCGLQDALDRADSIIENVQQQPPEGNCSHSEEKSLQEKLYDIYVEECEKEPEEEGLKNGINLLDKLIKKEPLACLVVNLYPDEQGYSLMLKDENGELSESFRVSYNVDKVLEYLNAEELAPALLDALEDSPVNVYHNGCIITEIRDYRQSDDTENPDYKSWHILLRPTMQTLLCDVEAITSDDQQWTEEEKLEIERQLILATSGPLCLDPSVAVACTTNKLLFNEQAKNTDPMGLQSLKRRAEPTLNQQALQSNIQVTDDDEFFGLNLYKAAKYTDEEQQSPSGLDSGFAVDVQKPSGPFDNPIIWSPLGATDGCVFNFEDGTELWETKPTLMQLLNDPLFCEELVLPAEDGCKSPTYPPHIPLGDSSANPVAEAKTQPIDVSKSSVKNKTQVPDKMPQESNGSVHLGQPTSGRKSKNNKVSSSVVEKTDKTLAPPVTHLSNLGSLAVKSLPRQTSKGKGLTQITPALKSANLLQETVAGWIKSDSVLSTIQLPTKSSKSTPASQNPASTTTSKGSRLVMPKSGTPVLTSDTVQPLGSSTAAAAPDKIPPKNSEPTSSQLHESQAGATQGSMQASMHLIVNNSSNPVIVKLPPGSVIVRPDPQQPQRTLCHPECLYVLIPQQQHQSNVTPPPSQPVPLVAAQGSNGQQWTLPAQQGDLPNLSEAKGAPQAQTTVLCQTSSVQQNRGQNSIPQSFQISPTLLQQLQNQGHSTQVGFVAPAVSAAKTTTQLRQITHTANQTKGKGRGVLKPPPES